jgi:phage protein D
MSQGKQIKSGDLGLTMGRDDTTRLEDMSLEEVEAFLIKKALARADGNARRAAEALGLSRSAFYRRLRERKEQLVHLTPASDREARALAEAAFRRIARRFVTGVGVTDGDPRLRVGATVNMQGLGAMFDGKYYVTEARHTFDQAQGYRTQIRVERPFIGG